MKNFYWKKIGQGKVNVILLSGWGINSKIWFFIIRKLKFFFKFYLIDLPGSGENQHLSPMPISKIIEILHRNMPKNSIWLGWSIGGLIANQFALSYPEDILALINVASSPCFIEKKNWPGIKKNTVYHMYIELKNNYYKTVNDFLNIQKTEFKNYSYKLTILKNILCAIPQPSLENLRNGLKIILLNDLRDEMSFIKVPFLRIYGELDNLVPIKISTILDIKHPNTYSNIIKKSSHAPFISHEEKFCSILLNFKNFF